MHILSGGVAAAFTVFLTWLFCRFAVSERILLLICLHVVAMLRGGAPVTIFRRGFPGHDASRRFKSLLCAKSRMRILPRVAMISPD
jgi:hypothetical protein